MVSPSECAPRAASGEKCGNSGIKVASVRRFVVGSEMLRPAQTEYTVVSVSHAASTWSGVLLVKPLVFGVGQRSPESCLAETRQERSKQEPDSNTKGIKLIRKGQFCDG